MKYLRWATLYNNYMWLTVLRVQGPNSMAQALWELPSPSRLLHIMARVRVNL
jgi:hypothetical protein